MKRILIALSIMTAVIICGCVPGGMRSSTYAKSTIYNIFQAQLPASLTNAYISSSSLMTLVVYGKFECSSSDFTAFLAESTLLPDKLKAGSNPLARVQCSNLTWWQPETLDNTSGVQCDWDTGADVASCKLVVGQNTQAKQTTVYFRVVYESKNQSGLRPEVKADPHWGQETNKISNQKVNHISKGSNTSL